ncbi:hypothetical protein SAMN02745784_02164 [Tissierella praeacuta DSM 18095]|uniref:Enterocin A Immunity n=1 Tax=Tissierella praeacuta DSM 18095 TaxID=1123404 RepID=A0A1M4X9I5_9FIRM|nr:hypothetical protein [Tissierella praeacuta]SHE90015.1 hypothetical protein SAMN02745784_02164 [Tissierella praeacuta DSM 18095]SUP02535.1 Uncharacterised protein [Tissierella praeacuta]
MKNIGHLTGKEFEEIKMLADKAVSANNKKSAESFINRLDFMQRTLDIEPYKRNVLAELVSYVLAATGQVRDKEHWMDAVNQSLFKLEPFAEDMGDMK